jgi:O-antigen/teichoic acid export membrane protein
MAEIKDLAKQTAIYGLSSILGKFLNWCLVPLYTFILAGSAEYGIVTNLYAWTALLLVILTYGMETGFFRFVNKKDENATSVYSSTLLCVGSTSLLFAALTVIFSRQIANFLGYDAHSEYISMIGIIVAMDAFGAIPFAYLRYKDKAFRFAMLKLIMIFVNIFFNIFFLVICPWIYAKAPALIDWFYNPDYGVGYVFVANFISTVSVTLLLIPQIRQAKLKIDFTLLKKIVRYSLPLLVLGIAGIMNQTVDKIIFPYLIPDREVADAQLGIYGACFKIAMIMMVFTQAFRYAYEPFIFAQNRGGDKKGEYADAMKFFIIFSLLIFLGMIFYLDILKYFIRSDYWEGLRIVPIILMSYLFQGIFFNLSLWYKLIDKTQYGAYFSIVGLVLTLSINIIFVPYYGYMASASASFICNFAMMLISYYYGQKNFKINYDLKSVALYFIVAMALYAVSCISPVENEILKYLQNTCLLFLYLLLIVKRDLPLHMIPVINKFAGKKKRKEK